MKSHTKSELDAAAGLLHLISSVKSRSTTYFITAQHNKIKPKKKTAVPQKSFPVVASGFHLAEKVLNTSLGALASPGIHI